MPFSFILVIEVRGLGVALFCFLFTVSHFFSFFWDSPRESRPVCAVLLVTFKQSGHSTACYIQLKTNLY